MKKLHSLALVPFFAFSAQVAMAEPVDSGPPAQQQKNAVPDTTSKGDYLKNENGTVAADGTNSTYPCDNGQMNSKSKTNSPEKGKSHNKPPEKGGVDVKS